MSIIIDVILTYIFLCWAYSIFKCAILISEIITKEQTILMKIAVSLGCVLSIIISPIIIAKSLYKGTIEVIKDN